MRPENPVWQEVLLLMHAQKIQGSPGFLMTYITETYTGIQHNHDYHQEGRMDPNIRGTESQIITSTSLTGSFMCAGVCNKRISVCVFMRLRQGGSVGWTGGYVSAVW